MSKPYGGEDFQRDIIEVGHILNENPGMDIFTAMRVLGDKQQLEENIANSNDEYHDENHNYKTDDRRLYMAFDVNWDDTNSELDVNQYTRIAVTPADYYDNKKQWFGGWLGPILTNVLYSLDFGEYGGCTWLARKQLSVTDIVEAFKKIGWDVLYLPESTRYETWAEAFEHLDESDDDGYADEWHYKNGDYKTDDKRLYFEFDVDEDDVDCEDGLDSEEINNYTRIAITPADFYDKHDVKRPVMVFTIPVYIGHENIIQDLITLLCEKLKWSLEVIDELYKRENQKV